MATRSLTHIFKDDKEICCIYRQFDGYPSGHGKDIAEFILSRKFVNGISDPLVFNGMGCFAAMLVSHLKGTEAGGIYIHEPGSTDCGEEFVYNVYGMGYENPRPPTIECTDTDKTLFKGSAADFLEFCKRDSE
jgi:hypothetical protein